MNRIMKQTLTIEQMQHLQELGLELKESLLYWARCVDNNPRAATHYGKWVLIKGNNAQTVGLMQWEFVPAYTLADIIEMLPSYIHISGKNYWLEIGKENEVGTIDEYIVQYTSNSYESLHRARKTENLIDAAYETLCWCLENKYIETKEK